MSTEDVNLSLEVADGEDLRELYTSRATSDPIIRDFVEEVLALAQKKASLSTKYTARDIILASKMVIPSNLTRLKGGNVTPFALALKEEKCNAPPEALKQQAGQKRNGKPGLDGRYAKWVKTQFDNPEKNAYYREKAKKMNEKGEEGGDSSCDRELVGILDLKSHQARGLRDLEKLVSPRPGIQVILNTLWLMHWDSLKVVDLAGRDIHIICLATPSENIKPLTFSTGRPAESF